MPRERVPAALLIAPQIVPSRRCPDFYSDLGAPVFLPIFRRAPGTASGNRKQSGERENQSDKSELQPISHHNAVTICHRNRYSSTDSLVSIRKLPHSRTRGPWL